MIWGVPIHFIPLETSTWLINIKNNPQVDGSTSPEDAVSSFQWLHCNPILRGPVDASLGVADEEKAEKNHEEFGHMGNLYWTHEDL